MHSRTSSTRREGATRWARFLIGVVLASTAQTLVVGCEERPTAPRLSADAETDPFLADTVTRTADAVDQASGNPKGWFRLGEIYYAHDFFESALACFDVAVRLAPDDPRMRYVRAVTRDRLGDSAGALEDLDAALQADPSTPHLRWRGAHWYRDAGDLDRAETLAQAAMKLSNGDRNSRRTLALVVMEQGRPEAAVQLLTPILQRNPNDRETRSTLVQALRMTGDLESAEREAVKAGDVRPKYFDDWINEVITRRTDLPIWIRRSQRHAGQRDTVAARRILENVLKRWYPEAREVAFTEGVILGAEGRHAEAAELFETLIAEHPEWSQAMTRGAASILLDGRGSAEADVRARTLLERSLEIEPENVNVKLMLAEILDRSREFEAARALMTEVVAAQGWQVDRRVQLARLQEKAGDPEAALATLDAATAIFGPRPMITVERISALIGLDRLDEAKALIDELRRNGGAAIRRLPELEARLRKAQTP